jgi:hypothetical protein
VNLGVKPRPEVSVLSRVTRVPLIAAAIGAITILAAGCASGGHAPGATASTTALSPQKAIELAATQTTKVNAVAATVSVRATVGGSSVNISGSFQEQLHPSVLVEADFSNFSAAGQSLPGGLAEIITTKAFYMKFPTLTQELKTSKPWVEIPLTGSGLGGTLSSLLNDVQSSSPLTQTQLLSGATDVKKVGTSTIDGVPVTEYEGSVPFSVALAKLPASLRSQLSSEISQAGGIQTIDFKIWVDGQNLPRKEIVTETGTSINETVTVNITSYNQPVSITLPTAAQTYVIPASQLGTNG